MNNRHRLVTKLRQRKMYLEAKDIANLYRPSIVSPCASTMQLLRHHNAGLDRVRYFQRTYLDVKEAFERYRKHVIEAFSEGQGL